MSVGRNQTGIFYITVNCTPQKVGVFVAVPMTIAKSVKTQYELNQDGIFPLFILHLQAHGKWDIMHAQKRIVR